MIALLRFIAVWLIFSFLFRLIRAVIHEFSRKPAVSQEHVRAKPKPIDAEDVDYTEIKE